MSYIATTMRPKMILWRCKNTIQNISLLLLAPVQKMAYEKADMEDSAEEMGNLKLPVLQ